MRQNAYVFTPQAKADLITIRKYTVKNWGRTQSTSYITQLNNTLSLLAHHPNMGKKRTDIHPSALSFPYASHVIYYFNNEKMLVVFAILHQCTLPTKHLKNRFTSML